MSPGIIEIDLHGLNVEDALRKVNSAVNKADKSVYIVRVIHGYRSGTRIKEAIIDEFSYGRNPRVKSIKPGMNQGITELILRE
ncbi:MAG: Smr/MutS family protein [Lachnospiraceae bacterium]|nr:Smr/MutS family protein [Lachnospiraceae bacterium]